MRSLPVFLLFLSLAQVCFAESSTPMGYWNNRKAVRDLTQGNPGEAQNKILSGLARDPYDANLHLNLGLTYEALGQVDKAQQSYEVALKLAKNPQTRFAAAFNLGETFQKLKKTDEALQFYQLALQDNPQSVETKTNIELLTQDQQGKGKGKDDKDKDKKDGKEGDQKKDDPGKDEDQKDGKGDSKDPKKDQKPKQYQKNKPQPQKFKSEDLTPGDVNKILGEIKQQEQKIRGEFNKKEVKEKPRDKDW